MKEPTLFNKERRQKILQILRRDGSVSVGSLADFFHVTPATIRADLTRLETDGQLIRTHGGAIPSNAIQRESQLHERHHEEEKNRIAEKAVEFVCEGDTLLLDTGTTLVSFARALVHSPIQKVTVFSNDIDVIRILEEKEGFCLHLFAGKMRNGYHYCYGSEITELLRDCHFDKMFLGSSAVSIAQGLTTSNVELAQLKRDMIRSCNTVFLLADSSKLHHVEFQKFADLAQMDVLIMDSKVTESDVKSLKEAVRKLILV